MLEVAPLIKVPPELLLLTLEYHWYVGVPDVLLSVTESTDAVPFKQTELEAGCAVMDGAGFTLIT